ncbi:MAG TPA: MOSC domain-containing protein [Alphaproteobacteria bacterium]|nr:MOSC domain-containing protein [Alphaproteobacteria bacterium]
MSARIAQLCIYPVKGLSPQPIQAAELCPGACLPNDRRFAIAHGASRFDPAAPDWQPKRQFLMLMQNERLAALNTDFDPSTGVLTIRRDGKQVARGNIETQIGRDLVNQFFAAYMGREALGSPKLVEAPGVNFTDTRNKVVSIINLATLADLERVTRRPVDWRRFRGNVMVEGLAPWAEFELVGREIALGDARLKVVERIGRCAATNVDPDTGARDLNVPKSLLTGYGHADCGVYAEVVEGGAVRIGDPLTTP